MHPQMPAQTADLVLVQTAQGLQQEALLALTLHQRGTDVVVRLDHFRLAAHPLAGLDQVGIQSALGEVLVAESGRRDAGLLHPDEQVPDAAPLLFGIVHPAQGLEELP